MPADLSAELLLRLGEPRTFLALAVVLLGGVVRGFAGFGTGLIYMPVGAALFGPKVAAAALLLFDLAAVLPQTLRLLPKADVRAVLPLSLGGMAMTPVGVLALATLDPVLVRWIISAVVLGGLALIMAGWRRTARPGLLATLAVGGSSGFLNGLAQIGGPPVILFYFASPAGAAAGRASLVMFFLALDVIGLGFMSGMADLVGKDTLVRAALYLPALLAGIWVGGHAFRKTDEAKFRRAILALLTVLALLIIAKAVAAL